MANRKKFDPEGHQDNIIAGFVGAQRSGAPQQEMPTAPSKKSFSPGALRKKHTFNVYTETVERARDCVVFLGYGHTLGDFVDQAIREKIQRVQEELNGEEPIPKRGTQLHGGRQVALAAANQN